MLHSNAVSRASPTVHSCDCSLYDFLLKHRSSAKWYKICNFASFADVFVLSSILLICTKQLRSESGILTGTLTLASGAQRSEKHKVHLTFIYGACELPEICPFAWTVFASAECSI